MANVKQGGLIRQQEQANMTAVANKAAAKGIVATFNAMVDSEGYQKRFHELLGKRTPQFLASVVSLMNADTNLQKAFRDNPVTVIQSALKAATYDLPIDSGLGYAYIVPFGSKEGHKAQFILGYKGQLQLALRTGAYQKINVIDVREGELIRYDRLTEEIELDFIEDEDERESRPIIGWCGFFRLVNGMEKKLYMSKKQIDAHEKKHRKGNYQGFGWKDNYEAMAAKTVLRRLLGKWGIMSIDYQQSPAIQAAVQAINSGQYDDEDTSQTIDVKTVEENGMKVDPETGEILTEADDSSVDHIMDDRILEESIGIGQGGLGL